MSSLYVCRKQGRFFFVTGPDFLYFFRCWSDSREDFEVEDHLLGQKCESFPGISA